MRKLRQLLSRGLASLSLWTIPALATEATPVRSRVSEHDVEVATAHYDRAYRCYEHADYPCALAELGLAYELSPSPKLLANIGKVLVALKRYREAVAKYEQCLTTFGDGLAPELQAEIQSRIVQLKQPVSVDIQVNLPDAQITIDGVLVGTAPLTAPLALAPGRHGIRVSRPGFLAQERWLELTPGSSARAVFMLQSSGRDYKLPIAWSITGVLAAAAGVTGVWALSKSHAQSEKLSSYPVSHRELEQNASELKTLADVTTGLIVAASAATAFSLWFSFAPERSTSQNSQSSANKWSLGVVPTGVRARMTF